MYRRGQLSVDWTEKTKEHSRGEQKDDLKADLKETLVQRKESRRVLLMARMKQA